MSMTSLPMPTCWPEPGYPNPGSGNLVSGNLASGNPGSGNPEAREGEPAALARPDLEDTEFLLRAFRSFSDAAGSLERSYGLLRAEVERLHRELEESNTGLARSLEENRGMRVHLDHILEGLPCGVLVASGAADQAGNETISRTNPEARRLLGFVLSPSYLELRKTLGMGVR